MTMPEAFDLIVLLGEKAAQPFGCAAETSRLKPQIECGFKRFMLRLNRSERRFL